jgi:hypothetical protein
MDLFLKIDIKKLQPPIRYSDRILLMGSCFTEHIGNSLSELKFNVLQNPNGILFGADSVCRALLSYVNGKEYKANDLIYLNELWQSWDHHSRYSGTVAAETLAAINESQLNASRFLREADCLVITLGSAFIYKLTVDAERGGLKEGDAVANCHRAPSSWFKKELMSSNQVGSLLEKTIEQLQNFNQRLRVIFTISPVRHSRDGVVENNRSKAQLISAVHNIIEKYPLTYYFPAYELVVDVLRDYRFYDIDLVHPNYAATSFVLEQFSASCISEEAQSLMKDLRLLVTARKHRAFQPGTNAHRQFLVAHLEKARILKEKYPFLDLDKELAHFTQATS